MAGLHQRADNGRRSCSAPPPENQELSASLQQCNNPVTGKVHFTPKVFSVMHSMHHNASDGCILYSWESWNDFLLHQTSYSNARSVMQNKELISKSTLWRRLFRVEQTHSVFFSNHCFCSPSWNHDMLKGHNSMVTLLRRAEYPCWRPAVGILCLRCSCWRWRRWTSCVQVALKTSFKANNPSALSYVRALAQ